MNHLAKIIIINSYNVNKINSFEVSGGCLVQGTNGAGKTSLLRLSLLFFGTQPDAIAKIAGKGNRFADYYLKTPSSYVAFEYMKEGEPRLLIVFSKAGGELRYQFYDGAFEEKLFLDAHNRFVSNEEIKAHIQATTQRRLSPQFSWSQYREIIQSAIRKSGNLKDTRPINEAKLKYSLCEPNKSIQNTDKVAISILSSKPSLQSVRELIAHEIIGMDNLMQTAALNQDFNPEMMNRQRQLLRQAKAFKTKQPLLVEMKSIHDLLKDLDQDLLALNRQCSQGLSLQQQKAEQARQQVVSLTEGLQVLKSEFEAESGKLNTQIGQYHAELTTQTAHIKRLEQQYLQYQQQDIDGQTLLASRLEALQAQKEGQQALLTQLTENVQHIVQQYEAALAKLQLAIDKQKNQARDLYDDKTAEIREQIAKLEKQALEEQRQVDDQFDSQAQRQQQAEKALLIQQSKTETLQENPINAEIKRLNQLVEAGRVQLSEQQTAMNEALRRSAQKQGDRQILVSQREEALRLYDRLKSEKIAFEAQKVTHKTALKNLENTVFFKMKALSPERADLALLAFNPDLLKKPLNEDLVFDARQENQASLLGFELDVSDIPALQMLEQDELIAALAQLEQALAEKMAEQDDVSVKLNSLAEQIPLLEHQVQAANLEVTKLETQQAILQKAQLDTEKRLQTEKQKMQQGLRQDLKNMVQQLAKLKQEAQENEAEKHRQRQQLQDRFSHKRAELDAQTHQAWQNFENTKQALSEQLNIETERMERLKQQDLSEAGAQAEEIARLEKQIEDLITQLDAAKQAEKQVEAYLRWRENEYSQLALMQEKAVELGQALASFNAQLEGLTETYRQQQQMSQAQLTQQQTELSQAEKQVSELEAIQIQYLHAHLERLGLSVSGEVTEDECLLVPAHELKKKVVDTIKLRKTYDEQGRANCYKILQSLKQTKALEETVQGALTSEGLADLSSAQQWRIHIKAFDYLMGDYLSGLIDGIHQEYRILSQRLIDLDARLEDTARRIKEKGREISRKMNESGTSFSKIEAIEAKITSNIDQIGFRRSLREAVKGAEEVKRLPEHESPKEGYFELVSLAISDIDRYGKRLQLEQFIEIEIAVKNKGMVGVRTAKNDKELHNIDSEGLSFLILLSLYMAIKNTFQKSRVVKLLWPIDELGKLHHENVEALMQILKREQVDFLCAEPSTNPKVLSLFQHIYEIKANARIVKIDTGGANNPVQAFLRASETASVAQPDTIDQEGQG